MKLSFEQIERFKKDGVLVIENVLTKDEIDEARKGLYASLELKGMSMKDTNSFSKITELSSTHGAGGVLDIFYEDWKFELLEHPIPVSILQQLWAHTYGQENSSLDEAFSHPFGDFDCSSAYAYIDRICVRLPDSFSHLCQDSGESSSSSSASSSFKKDQRRLLQRGLSPHLDCCPDRLYDASNMKKWKPIQAFLSLTDTLECNQGGFEACLGHHRHFSEWAKTRKWTQATKGADTLGTPPICIGEFTAMRSVEDADILSRMEHVPCRKGSLVVWDNRIPHANSRFNSSNIVREVVYFGLLPNIQLNREYAVEQLANMRRGQLPSDQWHARNERVYCSYEFSELGRKLLAIDPWP